MTSDTLHIRITANPGETFLDRMIALVEGAQRQKTPNEIALTALLAVFTIIFLIVCVTLVPFAQFLNSPLDVATVIALLVCLIPTTIGALLSAIGIAGMDRVTRFNVLAMSGRSVEAAGDINVLLLDKTGTITFGNRLANQFIPVNGHTEKELAEAALLSSLADETTEGKSIVSLAEPMLKQGGQRGVKRSGDGTSSDPVPALAGATPVLVGASAVAGGDSAGVELIPFSAETRMSGIVDHGRHAGTQSVLQFGDVRLDVDRRLVSVRGDDVHLTPIEYELFKELALSAGRVITHRVLLSRVWGPQFEHEVTYLRPVITSLRKKLGTRLIKTEPAVGYRLQE